MKLSKTINLVTAVVDFMMAVIMMTVALSAHSVLAFVFGVIFIGMGVYFLRYYERQRRLEKMTPEERAAFFKSGEAILVPQEVERLTAEKQEKDGYEHAPKH